MTCRHSARAVTEQEPLGAAEIRGPRSACRLALGRRLLTKPGLTISDGRQTARRCALVLILLAAFGLRLASWTRHRFLEDEALYAVWGLQIATADDPMLHNEPVDKPPLAPYFLALSFLVLGRPLPGELSTDIVEAAARLPSLIASVASVAMVYAAGRRLWNHAGTGLMAAALLAVSPFDILFASTAFTDPLMVTLAMASLLAASSGRWGAAGILVGLAAATKQQALFFLPLIVAMGLVGYRSPGSSSPQACGNPPPPERETHLRCVLCRVRQRPWLAFAVGFTLVAAAALWWDAARAQRPGFLQQSLINYGRIGWAPASSLAGRAQEWLRWLSYFWASPLSWAALAVASSSWLLAAAPRSWRAHSIRAACAQPSSMDLVLAAFAGTFLVVHWLLGFQTWDRYLLGLVPLFALLFGRAFAGLHALFRSDGWRRALAPALGAVFALSCVWPAVHAARGELPPGSDHGAYDGIDSLATYIRRQIPSGSVLYHYWLGYHYRFYLYGAPVRLHWYPDPGDLIEDATVYRREPRYIGFPSWRDIEPVQEALMAAGIELLPVFEAARRDGSVSFRLYQLVGPYGHADPGMRRHRPS